MTRTLSQLRTGGAVPAARIGVAPARSSLRVDVALGLAAFLIGLAARLHGLGAKPYWLDEATTLHRASLGTVDMILDSLSFHHLPLYFLISRWFLPLGTDEASLRLPAALFGAMSCAILFGLARMLGDRRAAIGASMLLALSPFQVQYGQEARSYTLVISFILLALMALCRLVRDPACAALTLRSPNSARAGWLAYAAATLGALDTLSVALFWLLAGTLAIVAAAWRDPPNRSGLLINAAIVHALILVCYLPWIIAMHTLTHGDMGSGLDWVPPLNWARFWTTIQAVYLMRITSLIRFYTFPDGLPWLGLLTALSACAGLITHLRRDAAAQAAAIALLTLPLGLLVTSWFAPVWMPRYLAWSGPLFYLFAGLGVARIPRVASWAALAIMTCAGTLNLLPYYSVETKPLWDHAALLLNEHLSPRDVLLTDSVASINMMNLRLQRLGAPIVARQWTSDPAVALRWLGQGDTIWAVHGRVGQADHTTIASFNQLVAPLGAPCWAGSIGLDISVRVFTPPGRSCPAVSLP